MILSRHKLVIVCSNEAQDDTPTLHEPRYNGNLILENYSSRLLTVATSSQSSCSY